MNNASRNQGWTICLSAGFLAFVFLVGILSGSYWAIAIPVAVLVFFVLGLVAWVGHTIATIQVEPYQDATPAAEPDAAPASSSKQSS